MKLDENCARDLRTEESLRAQGWRVARVWECSMRDATDKEIAALTAKLVAWVRNPRRGTLDLRGKK
jgi:G:T-mismatch repair DNA endonuclease (very short patch repair protein)